MHHKKVNAPPPKKFSMPEFNIYNGQTDPVDHVRYYLQVMAYWFFDDDVMCRMFPASLENATLRWFTRLLTGENENFIELAEQLIARFITNR